MNKKIIHIGIDTITTYLKQNGKKQFAANYFLKVMTPLVVALAIFQYFNVRSCNICIVSCRQKVKGWFKFYIKKSITGH